MPIELPDMDPCVFCDLIAGRRDDWLVVEDTGLFVITLTSFQFEVGQVLVIPKRHASTILDLTSEEASAIFDAAQRISRAMVEAFDPDGITLYQNNGAWAGQAVPHFHLHVVPRRPGSDWGLGPPHLARFDSVERTARAQAIIPITDEKRRTAQHLREQLASVSA